MTKSKLDFAIFGAEGIDPETIEQMQAAVRLPISVEGALMPDAHLGYGLPIGGVLKTYNAVIPYGVGMDIGCRMCMSVFPLPSSLIDRETKKLREILISETRFGHAVFSDVGEQELFERKEFNEIKFLRGLKDTFVSQFGTSGHGNHFVDIGELRYAPANPLLPLPHGDFLAVLSHSGSRNFGAEVCRHYTKVAQDKLGLKGEAGKLAWLETASEEGEEYWQAMELAGEYARANHHFIHKRIAQALATEPLLMIENLHNFAWKERLGARSEFVVHRKGATPAAKGDFGIIPGTMATPAYVVAGKGNEKSLQSAAHGAGRLLSRRKALASISATELKDYLNEQGIELIGGGRDESPKVYKDIHKVMQSQHDLVETLALFFPKIVRME